MSNPSNRNEEHATASLLAPKRQFGEDMFGRLFLGLFAGAVFGILIQAFIGYRTSELIVSEFFIGPLIGGSVVAVLSAVFGGYAFPPSIRRIAIGFIAGIVFGAFVGYFIYAPLATQIGIDPNEHFDQKEMAINLIVGLTFGTPIGGGAGILAGMLANAHSNRRASRSKVTSK